MDSSLLNIEKVRGQSRIVGAKSIAPLKMLFPNLSSEFSTTILSSYGGGTLQGDMVRLDVGVGKEAKLFLGNQAWSRLYKNEGGGKACLEINGRLEETSQAHVFPEFTIPQAKSDFENSQNWDLKPGSLLFLVDGFVAGRIQNGEKFQYTRYKSEVKIHFNSKLLLKDVFVSQPEIDFPQFSGNFGKNIGYVNSYLVGNFDSSAYQTISKGIQESLTNFKEQQEKSENTILLSWDAPKENLLVTRAVSSSIQSLKDWIALLVQLLARPNVLGINPLSRKY